MLYNYLKSLFQIFTKTNKSQPSVLYVQKGQYYCWFNHEIVIETLMISSPNKSYYGWPDKKS